MDVTAVRAYSARRRRVQPVEVEQCHRRRVELRLATVEVIVFANLARQLNTGDMHRSRFLFPKAQDKLLRSTLDVLRQASFGRASITARSLRSHVTSGARPTVSIHSRCSRIELGKS